MFRTYFTRRFRLRHVFESDIAELLETFSDPEVMRFYDMERLTTWAQAQCLLDLWKAVERDRTGVRWAIADRHSDHLIGTCGFHNVNWLKACADVGYEVNRAYWGQGVMSEVLPVILQHGFHCLGFERVHAVILPGNRASIALARKVGFSRRGSRRDGVRVDGCLRDAPQFTLERDAWLPQKPRAGISWQALRLALRLGAPS